MPGLTEVQSALADVRASRVAAVEEARALRLQAEVLRARRAEAVRTADVANVTALDTEIAEAERSAAERRADAATLGETFDRNARDLLDIPIEDRIGQLDDHVPLLLFPVRLETKFTLDSAGTRLRVRIFPDDILVSAHDPLLTVNEWQSGTRYWSERARASTLDPAERRNAEHAAWSALATEFGGPRARYVARSTRSGTMDDEPLRPGHSANPPHVRLLPDQFVVIGLAADGSVVSQQFGRLVPDDLVLGPDPEAPVAELLRDPNGRLAADPKLNWLFDYDRAVEVGMAVTLPVPSQFAETGFHRVIAIGVKAALDAEAGATALEELLAEHRFTRGIDLVRQGAATNNTDGAASAFTTELAADEALVSQEVEGLSPAAELDHPGKSDAQRLAEALGVRFEAVSDWPAAVEAYDISDALAMNRALWPTTLGAYLRTLVGARLTDEEKSDIESFFLTYVTGRTLLPAIRVGTQPYGVLATSNFDSWTEPPHGGVDTDDIGVVVKGLRWFRDHFESVAANADPALAQLGTGSDSVAMSLRVIGQLASSVSFTARKAVTDEWAWNTLAFEGLATSVRTLWWAERERALRDNFAELGLDEVGLPLASLFFFDTADLLDVPTVDQDPELPLSETEGLSKFDGLSNYVDWLLTATDEDLRREVFKNAQGDLIAPPRALLYRLLHAAWLAQLSISAHDMIARFRPDLVMDDSSGSLVNVGGSVVHDGYATRFDAARLGAASTPRALGDLLLDFGRGTAVGEMPPEALPIQSQHEALARLSGRPTAVLERLFAEHVDLGSYRLDAWLTGVFSRRLDHMRRREGRARGIYLGAFGYVENVAPSPGRQPIDPQTLPEGLRGPESVVEQAGNGGFVHAPSLNQAVTAAVLRNGYLTHAEPSHREAMSVNLNSRRVRAALNLIEGIRAGQDLAALLGYRFERGLHENYPDVELDEFIYVLRARFPLVSRRLTPVPVNTPAEVIEARNVVDGYDLVEHIRRHPGFPHGIEGLPAAGPSAEAIQAELERLEEILDAVADLMLAESAHQATQSNVDRARGVIGAIADGEMPPVPDVTQTPRSGRVVTERVALHLPTASQGWSATPSPRARGNPRLNSWLAAQLPAPGEVGFEVQAPGSPPVSVTLDAVGLDAIDLVLMTADRFGDGSSELERFLADRWRADNDIPDDVVTDHSGLAPAAGDKRLVIDTASAAGATPLARLVPHLRALRRLVGSARGLNAQDYRLVTDSNKADPQNPKGYRLEPGGDLDTLPGRLAACVEGLQAAADVLETELNALAAQYDAVRSDASSFEASAWAAPLDAVRQQLRVIALFGVPEALPRWAVDVSAGAARSVYEQANAVLATVRTNIERAGESLAPLPSEPSLVDDAEESRRLAARLDRRMANLVDAAHHTLGAAFPLQPTFMLAPDARAEIEARLAEPIESDPLVIETWMHQLARVRPCIADLALAMTATQWSTGSESRAVPVQLPLRPADPWVGGAWSTPPEDGETLSVMTLDAPVALDADLEGLLVDEWTETIPDAKETTGLSFHFDRPNSVAPHSLLLAVPPTADGRWLWSELVGVVLDTFSQARLRAVEPDLVAASPLFQILPTALMPFSHDDQSISTLLIRDNIRMGG